MYFQNSVSLRNKDTYIQLFLKYKKNVDGKNVILKLNSILKSQNLFWNLISCILIEFRNLLGHIDYKLLYICFH